MNVRSASFLKKTNLIFIYFALYADFASHTGKIYFPNKSLILYKRLQFSR